jgi:hypothetical protein
MNGTMTLDKVIYPAPVTSTSVGQPAFGHELVAVVLTVHSPSTSTGKFAAIYASSKLVDSKKLVHIGRSTAKYEVSACLGYALFGTVGPGKSMTGCDIFQLSAAVFPSELKVTGVSNADWMISGSALQSGTSNAALGSAPTTVAGTVPATSGTTTVTGTTDVTGTTSVTGTTDVTGTTSVTGTTDVTGATSTPATTTSGLVAQYKHHRPGTSVSPKILRFAPRKGFIGTVVTITGRRLSYVSQVTFNGVPAVITENSAARIEVEVPAGATSGLITVSTASGTATSPKIFRLP